MDTIHHLLRLNVEIEGALRVLATGDNEIALKILDEKTRELSDIVSYLVHPEEDNENYLTEQRTDSVDKNDSSEEMDITVDSGLHQESVTFDDPVAESEAIDRIPVMNEPADTNASSCHKLMIDEADNHDKKASIQEGNGSKISQPEKPLEIKDYNPYDSIYEKAVDMAADSKCPDNARTSAISHEKSASEISRQDSSTQFAQKDKIRIDEMLSRREARDLSKAFTINDRFRFQLHIFGGSKEAFNTSIEAISHVVDYESAMRYLSGIMDIDSDDTDIVDFLAIIQNHFDAK